MTSLSREKVLGLVGRDSKLSFLKLNNYFTNGTAGLTKLYELKIPKVQSITIFKKVLINRVLPLYTLDKIPIWWVKFPYPLSISSVASAYFSKYFTVRTETSGEPFPRNCTSGRDKNKLAEVKPWLSPVIYGHAVGLLVDSQVILQNAKTCVAVVLSHLRQRTGEDRQRFEKVSFIVFTEPPSGDLLAWNMVVHSLMSLSIWDSDSGKKKTIKTFHKIISTIRMLIEYLRSRLIKVTLDCLVCSVEIHVRWTCRP